MKNKILSLIILAALLANSVLAFAGTTSGPYDDCTPLELKNGTCVKQIYPMSNYATTINFTEDSQLEVRIKGGQECFQRMDVDLPDEHRQRLFDGNQFDQTGKYIFSNQASGMCELTLLVKEK